MKNKLFNFFAIIISTFSPIITLISCEASPKTTKENQLQKNYKSKEAKNLWNQFIFKNIVENEWPKANKNIELEEAKKIAWNFYSRQKIKNNKNYWMQEINKLITNSTIKKIEVEGNNKWINAYNKNDKQNKAAANFYISYNVSKFLMDKYNILDWEFQIYKLLMSEIFFTTATSEELSTHDEKNIKNHLDSEWFNNTAPLNLYRGSKNEKKGLDTSEYKAKWFFLNQYLLKSTPTFVWEQTQNKNPIEQVNKIISNAESFNNIQPRGADLINRNIMYKDNILTTSLKSANISIEKLNGFKGIYKHDMPIMAHGEVDYSIDKLKQRLNTKSKSGFLTEEGLIKDKSYVWFDNNKIANMKFVQQFIPCFIALHKNSRILTISEQNKWVVNNQTGFAIEKNKNYVLSENEVLVQNIKENTGWLNFLYEDTIQPTKITKAYLGKYQEVITNKDLISLADNAKSFFYADKELLKNENNLRKLIFQLALNDSSIFDNAKEYIIKVRNYKTIINDQANPIIENK